MPQSNVAPTFVCKGETDKPRLVLGAAGSRRITSSILQVICGVVERHLPIDEAVAAPRIHALLSRKIWLEKPLAGLSESLKQNFHQIVVKAERDYKMGAVQALQFDEEGKCFGAADLRREGTAFVS